MKYLIALLGALYAAFSVAADERDAFQQLENSIRQQIICLDLVEGNVDVGRQRQATQRMFSTVVSNLRDYVAQGTDLGIDDLIVVREYVGSDDVLVGVFLGSMLSDDAELQQEKDGLREGRSLEEVNRLLWQRHGCGDAFAQR